MANSTSQYLADLILNWMRGNAFAAAPGTVYAGLFSTAPTENNDAGTEISAAGYARQAVSWSAITQSADHLHDQMSNSADLVWPAAPAGGYTVVGVGLYDALTNGHLVDWVAVTSQPVSQGVSYRLAAGGLVVEV